MWIDALSYHLPRCTNWMPSWTTLSFSLHIKFICKSAFYNISRFHPLLSDSAAESLVNAFIISSLDYYNGVLFDLANKALDKLQYVKNSEFIPTLSPGNTSTSHLCYCTVLKLPLISFKCKAILFIVMKLYEEVLPFFLLSTYLWLSLISIFEVLD